jgi:RNase adapter protein RapZ
MSHLIILTGMSGAGKSTAMLLFEELKLRCIENPPVELFTSLFELIHNENEAETTVVSVNLLNAMKALKAAKAIQGLKFEVVCLVASVQDLLSRYKLTRHLHPLQAEGYTLTRAIDLDLSLVESIKPSIDTLIDSSHLTAKNFRQKLMARFSSTSHKAITVSLVTFGFKHGVPIDADTVFDVRAILNPFYELTLRSLSGLDQPVQTFVKDQPSYQTLFKSALSHIQNYLALLILEGRPSYEVAIGCTGGRHRSVVFATALAEALSTSMDVSVVITHRDIEKMHEAE